MYIILLSYLLSYICCTSKRKRKRSIPPNQPHNFQTCHPYPRNREGSRKLYRSTSHAISPTYPPSQAKHSCGVGFRAHPILSIYITAYYMSTYLPITYISVRLEFLTDFIPLCACVLAFVSWVWDWDLGFGILEIVAVKGLGRVRDMDGRDMDGREMYGCGLWWMYKVSWWDEVSLTMGRAMKCIRWSWV